MPRPGEDQHGVHWQSGPSRACMVQLFKTMTGLEHAHVPYRGSPQALTDLIQSQVPVMFDNVPSSIGHTGTGRLRALAVTTGHVWPSCLDFRLSQFVPGYAADCLHRYGAKGHGLPTLSTSSATDRRGS